MKIKRILLIVFVIFAITGAGLVAYRLITGRGPNLIEKISQVEYIVQSVIGHNSVVADNGNYKNIVFIHHSVGHNLIEQGNLREQFQQMGYSFWDQDYMSIGLTGPDGKPTGYSYPIPGDNTDIDGYANIFQQTIFGLPVNAFSALLQHEVIIFKSCYPNSQIESDTILEIRKQEYLKIRQGIDQHPDRIFILITTPPMNPAETNSNSALRARLLSDWLSSKEFSDGHPNLFVFNLFDLLAESNRDSSDFNMLKNIYRYGIDSHPNNYANIQIAPLLANFVDLNVTHFRATKRVE